MQNCQKPKIISGKGKIRKKGSMERGRGNDFYLTEFQDSGCVGVTSRQMHRYFTVGYITLKSDFLLTRKLSVLKIKDLEERGDFLKMQRLMFTFWRRK